MKRNLIILFLALSFVAPVVAQTKAKPRRAVHTASVITVASVRDIMGVLASDEMKGRGSATDDELTAAKYIATELKKFKIDPAGADGGYIQSVDFTPQTRAGSLRAHRRRPACRTRPAPETR